MTLFDGQPLTEAEVASREMCLCDHTRGAHRGGMNCCAPFCGCKAFAFSGDTLTAETQP